MGFGAAMSGDPVQLVTCDINPCIEEPFTGLEMPDGSTENVMQKGSTEMFQYLISQGSQIDMLHIDGRLRGEDLQLLSRLLKPDTLIPLFFIASRCSSHISITKTSLLFLERKDAYIDPIAPAPIITIFFIKLLYVPEYKNSKEKRNNSCHP